MMDRIAELIKHPEYLDRDTLYELRSTLALYPYYQTARLLMLQNLYLLHDPSFDEELRRAAIYITDRRVLIIIILKTRLIISPVSLSNINKSQALSVLERAYIIIID